MSYGKDKPKPAYQNARKPSNVRGRSNAKIVPEKVEEAPIARRKTKAEGEEGD